VAKAKGNKRLIIVCVLAYFVFLMAMFPLNVIYQLADPKGLPVKVLAVSGTLWDGEVVVKHPMAGQVSAQWQLPVLPLFIAQLSPKVQIEGQSLNAELEARFNPLSMDLLIENGKGFVESSLINQFIRRNRAQIQGDFELSNLTLDVNVKDKSATAATGRLVWSGGQVKYPKGRKQKTTTMPMLVTDLSVQNGELLANMNTTDGLSVANANLKQDGWGGVAIKKRLIDLVGEPWPNKASADTTVFEVSEKIF
jgi:general secretion pathway protein N